MAIASWIGCGCLTGIPAIIVARNELAAIERGDSPAAGKGMAQAAFWVGVVNTVVYVLVGIIYLFAIVFAAATGSFR